MRVVILLAFAVALHAQSSKFPVGKSPVEGMKIDPEAFKKALNIGVGHIHIMAPNCQGQPDKIYAKSGNTYYACAGGKDVCSQDKGKITSDMIASYEAHMAQFRARMDAFKASVANRPPAGQQLAEMRARHAQTGGSYSRGAGASIPIEAPIGASASADQPPTVTAEQFAVIAVGTPKAEVLKLLGQPFSKISGEYESLTYLLAGGGTAKLEFEDQKVSRIQTASAQ